MICFRVSCYNLDGCKWCKLILVLHMSIWTNRSFHTDLQTQLSRGTAEISLNSWVWDLICWSLPAFSPLCVLWARVCACLSDLCVSDPTRPFFHLMALSHLRILIYSQTLWGSLKLSFLFCGSHTDCGWKIRPVCSDFLSLSVFLCFFRVVKEEIIDDNAKLPCYNGRVICWVRTETHTHPIQSCILIPWCSLHNRSAF